jgi:glycosyltransferase involved in cell wall biosynthesis
MRDYEGYPNELTSKWEGGYPRAAVKDHGQRVRTIFLGAENGQPTGWDETRPYVRGIPAFARALGNTHGDVGIASVLGDDFDRAKSELHFLEYSAAGMATIATRCHGDGPYNVIRDGVDGVLAHGRQGWSDGLKLLLNPNFREQIAGAALERIALEYSHVKRAQEWAESLRWAAEHRGIGRKAA